MDRKKYNACIFDLDGTLADTLASIAFFANGTLEHFGYPPVPKEDYKMIVGNGADMILRRAAAFSGAELTDEELKTLRAEYDRRYESEPMKLVTAYPGMPELLAGLKELGLRVGVLSNKPDNMTRYIVKALYGSRTDAVLGQRAGVPRKPDPAAAWELADLLGVSPAETLYIGDSGVDMDTGNNAGMDTVGVLWGFRSREELLAHGAGRLASDADELRRIVLGE